MPGFVAPARQVRCVLKRVLARDHGFLRPARYVVGRIIPQPGLNMARLFWMTLMVAFAGALLLGASWAAAFYTLGDLLGAPPPEMGRQSTDLLWQGAPELPGHPRAGTHLRSGLRAPEHEHSPADKPSGYRTHGFQSQDDLHGIDRR